MSDLLQSGYHPDADQLNAFVEHALPDHERQQTLAHLAVCPDCRAIVALSLPPVEEAAPKPFRKSWFSGWNLAWPMVAALAGLAVFFVHIRNVAIERKGADASRQVAISHPPPAALQAPATRQVSNLKPPPAVSEKRPPTSRRDKGAVSGVISKNAKPAIDAKSLEGFPVQNRNLVGLAQGGPTLGGSSLQAQLSPQAGNAPAAGVAGMKTPADHFEQPRVVSNANGLTEAPAVSGLYQQAPLPPPTPSAAPAAPKAASVQTTPAPTVISRATAQTVEVAPAPAADLSTLNAEVALPSIGNTIPQQPLPSKLPILSMVSNAHRILAIDTHNAVFFSDDDGTTWNAIPAQWRGRAVKVSLAASGTPGTFASHGRMASFGTTNSPSVSSQKSRKSGTGSALTGTVTDQSGAVIPDASVVIGNATTPNLRTVKTDRMGYYLIDDLVPGNYRVEVDATGFIEQQRDVILADSQQGLANFTLSVGSVSETVTVEAAAAPVTTLSATRKKDAARSAVNPSHPVDQSVFEMTTDTGDHWTSTDGHTWKHQ